MQKITKTAMAAAMAVAMVGTAEASHFRGASLVPSVDANGLMTVTSTSFWRPTSVSSISVSGMSQQSIITDTADSRFTRVVQVYTRQLSSAGTFDISGRSCCRVTGIRNSVGGSSVGWQMNSRIVWDGSTANTPISFDFATVQPNVQRGNTYMQNLNAVGGPGITLTYDNNLNTNGGGNFTQTPGFTIDTNTGLMTIPAADTAGLTDNTSNDGADYLFSGNIKASDGSFVEYDWLWDAVNSTGQNAPPTVNDIIVNALVGDTISEIMTAIDPDGDPLTWDFLSFLGGGANSPTFDSLTQLFEWDSTGSAVGQYIANIRANDGSFTDVGTVTINLTTGTKPPPPTNPPPTNVPEPGILALLSMGLLGMAGARRRKDV